MKLEGSLATDLDPRGVDHTQVSNEVPTSNVKDHELRLPELLVIGDDVVVNVSLSHLEL